MDGRKRLEKQKFSFLKFSRIFAENFFIIKEKTYDFTKKLNKLLKKMKITLILHLIVFHLYMVLDCCELESVKGQEN